MYKIEVDSSDISNTYPEELAAAWAGRAGPWPLAHVPGELHKAPAAPRARLALPRRHAAVARQVLQAQIE